MSIAIFIMNFFQVLQMQINQMSISLKQVAPIQIPVELLNY